MYSGSVNSYAKQLVELDHIVKAMIFDSYGLDRKKLVTLLESTDYVVRGYKYRTPKEGESNLGVAPHADVSFLTILNQKVEGLEVKLKNGEWCEVGASPSLFLVIAGDALTVSHFCTFSNSNVYRIQHAH
jgi:isopenicillin N synthase-like dioxygenase